MFYFIKKILFFINNNVLLDKYTQLYIDHNKRVWKPNSNKYNKNIKKNKQPIILVDLFQKYSLIHFWSYIVNVLSQRTNAKIEYFFINLYKGKTSQFELSIRKLKKIYESFNVQEGINEYKFNYSTNEKIFFNNEFNKLNYSKKKLLKYKINGVHIGDLIFDSYMRATYAPTVDMKDGYFKKLFFKSLKTYFEAKKYFQLNNVIALIPSHTVYHSYGIVSRIAAKKKIPIIKVNTDKRGNKNFRINLVDQKYVNEEAAPYFNFKNIFNSFSVKHKKKGVKIGKEILNIRLSGNYDKTLPYMAKSQFRKDIKKTKRIKKSKKRKIFIFPHCYFDAPHRYRFMMFNDFQEQIKFILDLSKKLNNFDWYYKPHPHELKGDLDIHKKILGDYPNVTMLNNSVGHRQIIETKPYCIISNNGTVGHEYAAFKIPSIFTGDNKHISYNFCLHLSKKNQIEHVIKNLKNYKSKLNFNRSEIYKFLYMNYQYFQNLYDRNNLIKDDYFICKNEQKADKPIIFNHLVKQSKRNHSKIVKYIENVIDSSAQLKNLKKNINLS